MFQIWIIISGWIIAIIGLFGNTFNNGNLNKKGLAIFILLTLTACLSGYTAYYEQKKNIETALLRSDSRKTVLYRLISSIEDIKAASLWKKRDYFSQNLPVVDIDKYTIKIVSPTNAELALSEELIEKPFTRATNDLTALNTRYSDYMKFKELDYVLLVLDTIKYRHILQFLGSESNSKEEYENTKDQYLEKYGSFKYFFTALFALEGEVKENMNKELKEYYKLRPECVNPLDSSTILSCL